MMKCMNVSQHMKDVQVEMIERGFKRTEDGLRLVYVCPICKDVKYVEVEEE